MSRWTGQMPDLIHLTGMEKVSGPDTGMHSAFHLAFDCTAGFHEQIHQEFLVPFGSMGGARCRTGKSLGIGCGGRTLWTENAANFRHRLPSALSILCRPACLGCAPEASELRPLLSFAPFGCHGLPTSDQALISMSLVHVLFCCQSPAGSFLRCAVF